MEILLDRDPEYMCFASDVESYKRTVFVKNEKELDTELFSYLPHVKALQMSVWLIVIQRKSQTIVYGYFIDGQFLRRLEHSDEESIVKLENSDRIFCKLYLSDYHQPDEPKAISYMNLLERVKYYSKHLYSF